MGAARDQYLHQLGQHRQTNETDLNGLESIGEENGEDYRESSLKAGRSVPPAGGPSGILGQGSSPRLQTETMLKKESQSKLRARHDSRSGHRPTLKYQKYGPNSRNNGITGGRSVEGSTFGSVGAQTLSGAVRSRLILKGSYGMPKEVVPDFKPANLGEAKESLLRDPRRDPESIRRDQEILDFITREHRLKHQTPSLRSLNLKPHIASFQSAETRNRSTHRSGAVKGVAFARESASGTPRGSDANQGRAQPGSSLKLKMDPSSSVLKDRPDIVGEPGEGSSLGLSPGLRRRGTLAAGSPLAASFSQAGDVTAEGSPFLRRRATLAGGLGGAELSIQPRGLGESDSERQHGKGGKRAFRREGSFR